MVYKIDENGAYRKGAIVVQDATPGSTITTGIADPDLNLDRMTIIRTDGVTQ